MRHPLFHFFSSFSLFGRFFFDFFYFTGQAAHFLFFYRFIWFHYNFSVFMVLIFFSRCHVFYPLFHLSGLPFSFFCKQSHFFSFINIFYSFSPFLFFSPMSILHFPLFSRFLPFLNSFLSFLLFPPLPSFYTLFLPFF